MMEGEKCGGKTQAAHDPEHATPSVKRASRMASACTAARGTSALAFIDDCTARRSSMVNVEVSESILRVCCIQTLLQLEQQVRQRHQRAFQVKMAE